MIEYNDRSVYDWFNHFFPVYGSIPELNIHPITIDYSHFPSKISWYTSDMLPDSIYVTYGNSVSTLTTPSEYPQLLVMNYYDPYTIDGIYSFSITTK